MFVCLAMQHVETLVSQLGIEPVLLALEALKVKSLNHWATRESPRHDFYGGRFALKMQN